MVTTLRILGDERLVAIDEQTRATLGIDESTPLSLSVERGRLIITPEVRGGDLGSAGVAAANGHEPGASEPAGRVATEEQIADAIRELRPKYTKMLRKLAE